MTVFRQTWELLRWELRLEWREKAALGSVLLYVVATVVLIYLAVRDELAGPVFNALYWIVVLFGATVAAGRSFLREGGSRHLYYYQLAHPLALLASKLLANTLTIWLIAGLVYALLSLFAPTDVVRSPGILAAAALLGGFGIAAVLTFTALLTARSSGSGALMAVLSFPLLIPLLQLLVQAGIYALDGGIDDWRRPLYLTAAVDLLVVSVGVVLFPLVWRD